jgi:tetratricopeptide (TPR) repeat protein
MSKYAEMKEDRERALQFIDKAVNINPRHYENYVFKGSVLISEHASEAIAAYRKAYHIQKDLVSFQGLVEGYLAVNRIKEALSISKEALQMMPKNPKTLILVGVVLSHTPDGKEKARKAFENALLIDPACTEAVIAIVSNNIATQNWQSSIELLEKHLNVVSSDFLHTRLGDIYTLVNDFSRAMMHYNAALGLNGDYERAIDGLNRVQKLMNRNQESDKMTLTP